MNARMRGSEVSFAIAGSLLALILLIGVGCASKPAVESKSNAARSQVDSEYSFREFEEISGTMFQYLVMKFHDRQLGLLEAMERGIKDSDDPVDYVKGVKQRYSEHARAEVNIVRDLERDYDLSDCTVFYYYATNSAQFGFEQGWIVVDADGAARKYILARTADD